MSFSVQVGDREHRVVRHQPQHRVRAAQEHREPASSSRCSPTCCASAATPTGCSPTPTIDDAHARPADRARGLLGGVHRLVPHPDGRRDLVDAARDMLLDYPAGTFLRFCDNHGLLHVTGKPMWRSVIGGSRTYVEAAAKRFSGEVFTGEPVERVERLRGGGVTRRHRQAHRASTTPSSWRRTRPRRSRCSPTPTAAEREVLGAFNYWPNDVVLHTDAIVHAREPRARGRRGTGTPRPATRPRTCSCSRTGSTPCRRCPTGAPPVIETLNPTTSPTPRAPILEPIDFEHPMFTAEAIAAQKRAARDPGRRRHLVRRRLDALRLPRGRPALGGARRRGARRDAPVGRRARREPHARARAPSPSRDARASRAPCPRSRSPAPETTS